MSPAPLAPQTDAPPLALRAEARRALSLLQGPDQARRPHPRAPAASPRCGCVLSSMRPSVLPLQPATHPHPYPPTPTALPQARLQKLCDEQRARLLSADSALADLRSRLASAELRAAAASGEAERAKAEEAAARERADDALFRLASAQAQARELERRLNRRTEQVRGVAAREDRRHCRWPEQGIILCCFRVAEAWLAETRPFRTLSSHPQLLEMQRRLEAAGTAGAGGPDPSSLPRRAARSPGDDPFASAPGSPTFTASASPDSALSLPEKERALASREKEVFAAWTARPPDTRTPYLCSPQRPHRRRLTCSHPSLLEPPHAKQNSC